jgi:hypothetical protein
MNRIARISASVLVCLAGCGEQKPPAAANDSRTPAKIEAPKPEDAAKEAKADAAAAAKAAKIAATQKALAAQTGDIPFTADWQAAMAQAKSAGKPLMFLFTDKDNADGAKMGAGAFKDPKIVAAAAAFVAAVVDADADAPLAEQFGARTTPTIVYASPTGEVLGSSIAAEDILNDIQAALAAQRAADAANK